MKHNDDKVGFGFAILVLIAAFTIGCLVAEVVIRATGIFN